MTISPRVLILTHCFPANDSDIPGNFLPGLLSALAQKGIKCTVITQKMDTVPEEELVKRTGAGIIYFDWKGGKKRFAGMRLSSISDMISAFSLIRSGRKELKKLSAADDHDLILCCWAVPAGLWAVSFKKNRKLAVWALGSDINQYGKRFFTKSVIGFILRRSGTIFSNSLSISKTISQNFGLRSKVLCTARTLPETEVTYRPDDVLRLVFIGRLEQVKGPDILISALILSGIMNFSLRIIGGGSMTDELKDLAGSNGLSDRIFFTGQGNGETIAKELRSADYLVIPSRSESMPVVFWEAMQENTPVLAANTGDLGFYCEKYNVGRIFEPDSRSLSELLSFISQFRPLRDVMAKNTEKVKYLSDIRSSAEQIALLAKSCAKSDN